MPRENKVIFWGELDTANETLKRVAGAYKDLLDRGEFRMTCYNIERMDKYLAEIQASIRTINSVTDEFRPIATNPVAKELSA